MIKLLLFLSLVLIREGIGESLGLDLLALESLSKKDCKLVIETVDSAKVPKLGYLWGTFTKNKNCTIEFLRKNAQKEHVIRVHATNETCRRPPRYCEKTEINSKFSASSYNSILERANQNAINSLRKRVKAIRAFFDNHSNNFSRILISTGLEDNFTKKAFLQVLKIYKEELEGSRYTILRNPLKQIQQKQTQDIIEEQELHKIDSYFPTNRCVFSNDGVDIDLKTSRKPISSIEAPLTEEEVINVFGTYLEICRDAFLWWNSQGIQSKFVPPLKRKISLNHEDLRKIKKIIRRLEQ